MIYKNMQTRASMCGSVRQQHHLEFTSSSLLRFSLLETQASQPP